MVKRKLNVKKLGIACGVVLVVLLAIIFFISSLVRDAKLHKTPEFKLGEIGYTENEVKVITAKLKDKELETIINSKYKKDLTKFLKEKYFIYDNLEKYLSYYKENNNLTPAKVVGIVNTKADAGWYSKVNNTDTSKGKLMLVNKFYSLKEDYVPEDLVDVPGSYAYDGIKVSKTMYDGLTSMLDAAKNAGYTILVDQGYRSYTEQLSIYNDIKNIGDVEEADKVAARPGHSEYQTGLSVSLGVYGNPEANNTSDEYKWLVNNSYRYGFILRFPENSEDITGFKSENWRFRFVGTDASSKIHRESITFDEYYEYYLNK